MLLNNMNVVIMFANPYRMEIEDTREIREGLTVEYYVFGENGEALKPVADAGNGALGIRRSKCSMDASMKDKLMYVPGIYDGQFEMTVGSDGKPTLKLVDIDFIGKCQISLDGDTAPDVSVSLDIEDAPDADVKKDNASAAGKKEAAPAGSKK